MIFGKKGCNENKDWKVRVLLVDDVRYIAGEQLTKKEAMGFIKTIKEKLKDKEPFLEFEDEKGYTDVLMKLKIVSVDVYRY